MREREASRGERGECKAAHNTYEHQTAKKNPPRVGADAEHSEREGGMGGEEETHERL